MRVYKLPNSTCSYFRSRLNFVPLRYSFPFFFFSFFFFCLFFDTRWFAAPMHTKLKSINFRILLCFYSLWSSRPNLVRLRSTSLHSSFVLSAWQVCQRHLASLSKGNSFRLCYQVVLLVFFFFFFYF